MSIQDRIKSLETKHEELESMIAAENSRSSRNDNLIHDLKRKKLKLKDEITALAH
jgi:hypothetical protein